MLSETSLEWVDSVVYTGQKFATRASNADGEKSGILERNGLVWYSRGSFMEIFRIDCDSSVIHKDFHDYTNKARKPKPCTVECVEEVVAFHRPLVAVALRLGPEQTKIILTTPQSFNEVGHINIQEDVRIMRFIDPSSYPIGLLSHYSGCLVVGTVDGKVIMVDFCFELVENGSFENTIVMNENSQKQCHIEFNRADPMQIVRHHEKVRERGMYFGLQFCHKVNASVESILNITPLKACCVGFADGTILIVDLTDQSLMHRIQPPMAGCAVVAMNYIEPTDDPMACLYLWVFYSHDNGAFAHLYMIMCEEKSQQDELVVYDQFQSCSDRLTLSSFDPGSVPLHVQSVTRKIGKDEVLTLSVLSWLGSDQTTTVLVFDLNQWYKAEMPYECDWKYETTHTVVFKLKELSFHSQMDVGSLMPFHSVQRLEEHFYPNSLRFDIMVFNGFHHSKYRWVGVQQKLLRYLDQDGANGLIDPANLCEELNRAALLPLFHDHVPCDDDNVKMQREFILSLGLQYNCLAFLQSCAYLWADGSCLGAEPERGVSLSTLTDWIWNRSATLKEVSNQMLAPLLDSGGPRIDLHINRDLTCCTEQMKRLAQFYRTILTDCKRVIPKNVMNQLSKECSSIALAAIYQDIILWLLIAGVLPEVPKSIVGTTAGEDRDEKNQSTEGHRLPYPYTKLYEFYRNRRTVLHGEDNVADSSDRACELLFIDNFIEREFDSDSIRKVWFDETESAERDTAAPLYPPESLQKALRVLLIPDVALHQKFLLLSYLFMDIVAVLGHAGCRQIFEELGMFAQEYKIDQLVLNRVRSFWHLDHGNVEEGVREFLTSSPEVVPNWHRELAVSVLLRLKEPGNALRVLRTSGCHVPPQLELTTLVRNNLIYEACIFQRRHLQPEGMMRFLETMQKEGRMKALLDINFTSEEKNVLRSFLRESQLPVCDSLLFGHLLQNGEFVEAVQHVDRLSIKRRNNDMEAYRDILSLYHKSLDPTSQRLAYLTYTEPKELEPQLSSPNSSGTPLDENVETLSARLIRNRADFRSRILHQSIVAIKEAAAAAGLQHERPFLNGPDLGVFKERPMVHSRNVSYPIVVTNQTTNKRKRDECDVSYNEFSSARYDGRGRTQPLYDDDVWGNPAKRPNLATDQGSRYSSLDKPVPIIPQFRPMVPQFNFTATANSTFRAAGNDGEGLLTKSISHSPSIFLQTPPLVKRERREAESSGSEVADSYTPPGILKPTQSGLGFAQADGEEKVLRFDLPSGATSSDGTGADDVASSDLEIRDAAMHSVRIVERRDLDLSGISNEDFYSPEVTMDDNSLQHLLCSGGPSRRRPLHRSSGSASPTGRIGATNNIAIIIEDHVDDDDDDGGECSNVATDRSDYSAMEVDEEKVILEDTDQDQEIAHNAGGSGTIVSYEIVPAPDNEESDAKEDECMDTSTVEAVPSMEGEQQPTIWHLETIDDFMVHRDDGEEAFELEEDNDGELELHGNEDALEIIVNHDQEQEEELGEVASENEDVGGNDEGEGDEEGHFSYEEDEDELHNGELDNSGEQDENSGSSESSSVLEVIDVSDERSSSPSSSSSSSSSSSGDDGAEQNAPSNPVESAVVAEPPRQQAESGEAPSVGPQQIQFAEFYSESVPRALFNDVEGDEDEDEDGGDDNEDENENESEDNEEEYDEKESDEEEDDELEQEMQKQGHADEHGEEPHDIQVPTTSSSTHRTETQEVANESAESSEVEDLSVCLQQEQAPEVADSSVASVGAAGGVRNLSVDEEQGEDGVASTSGNEEVVRVTPSATTGTTAAVSTPGSSASQAQSQSPAQQITFGQPKNAHELEVPAMNLSVKPDEAHGSSRKNSKGEENGLTEEARALNLSAGQQELAAQMARAQGANVSSNNDDDENADDKLEEVGRAGDNEPQSTDDGGRGEVRANEPHSSGEEKAEAQPAETGDEKILQALNEEEKMNFSLLVSDEEGEGDIEVRSSAAPSTDAEVRETNENENASEAMMKKEEETVEKKPKPSFKRSEEILQQHDEEASTSSPRTNVRTRMMIAMEKSAVTSPSTRTPTRRRSVRATSVVPESTDTSLTPSLSHSRRYASMDNVSGATPDLVAPLTPRRSTRRASSLAKELFANSTPLKRTRRQSQSSVESVDRRGSVPNSPTDAAMEPPEPSERSFASSTASSTRRSTRLRKSQALGHPLVPSESQPGTSTAPLLADYSSNRRLTRHQLAVMEKSMGTVASSGEHGRERASKLDDSIDTGADSEAESVVSNVSNQSSLRSTRSRATRIATRRSSAETRSNRGGSVKEGSATAGQQQPAEASEMDSDSDNSMLHASQRTTHGLEPIAEEGDEPQNPTTKRKRGRPTKSNK